MGNPSISLNTSFGKPPPKLGRMAGFLFVVSFIEFAAHLTQGLSGSSLVACIMPRSAGVTVTLEKPSLSRCLIRAGRISSTCVPTTNRN